MAATLLLLVQDVVQRTELQMRVATTRQGENRKPLAGAEGRAAGEGGAQRRLVDLRGAEDAVQEDHQCVAADEELLEGARRVHDHRQLLQVHGLQTERVLGHQNASRALECVVLDVVQV